MESNRALYYKLSSIYSSPHNDQREDIKEAVAMLKYAVEKEGVDPDYIIQKMEDHVQFGGEDYKTKVSVMILNRFWEKNIKPTINYKPITED